MKTILMLLLVAACSSMPRNNLETISSQKGRAYKDHTSLLMANKAAPLPVKLKFNENSPLLESKRGLTTAAVVSFTKTPTSPRYLVLSSSNHVVGYSKIGYVIPHVQVVSSKHVVFSPRLSQLGEKSQCGLERCFITSFDLSGLPDDNYRAIIAASVDDPDQPFSHKTEGFGTFASGMSIESHADIQFFADYFGTLEAGLSSRVPLDEARPFDKILFQSFR